MGDPLKYSRVCRCCGSQFMAARPQAETCSASCRKRVSRALAAGMFFEWGTLSRYVNDRRPPGLGVRRMKRLHGGKFSNNPTGRNGHEKDS